jgi:hypothetical protein
VEPTWPPIRPVAEGPFPPSTREGGGGVKLSTHLITSLYSAEAESVQNYTSPLSFVFMLCTGIYIYIYIFTFTFYVINICFQVDKYKVYINVNSRIVCI